MGTTTRSEGGERATGDHTLSIVERLRSEAEPLPYEVYYYLNPLLLEAADEIERLLAALHEADAAMSEVAAAHSSSYRDTLAAIRAVTAKAEGSR
jgi:hypothetical protein